jgi:hypothetical protein
MCLAASRNLSVGMIADAAGEIARATGWPFQFVDQLH